MYEPSSGTVKSGDTDILEFSLESWRKNIAIVSQDSPLMDGTVRENIAHGLEREASEEEIIEAAKQANAYDFIMETPDGSDAPVGPGGSKAIPHNPVKTSSTSQQGIKTVDNSQILSHEAH